MPESIAATNSERMQKTYKSLNTMQNDLVARAENYQKQEHMTAASKKPKRKVACR